MKRIIIIFFVGWLWIASAAADCLPIDADTLVSGATLSSRMQGIRMQATVEPPANVRLTIQQTNTASLIFDKTYGEYSGLFDSGELYFPYTGLPATAYTVTLTIGETALTFSFTQLQARLTGNSAYTLGPRLGGDWPMATVVDLTGSGTTVPICASNQYYIGQATFAVSDGTLTVSTSFTSSANVTVESQSVYLYGNPTSMSDNPLRQPRHAVGEAIDVTGLQTALVCVPITLSYDPFGLSDFVFSTNDSAVQRQLGLLGR